MLACKIFLRLSFPKIRKIFCPCKKILLKKRLEYKAHKDFQLIFKK